MVIPWEVEEGLEATLTEIKALRKENPAKRLIGPRFQRKRRVIFEMSHEGKTYSFHVTKGWRVGRD